MCRGCSQKLSAVNVEAITHSLKKSDLKNMALGGRDQEVSLDGFGTEDDNDNIITASVSHVWFSHNLCL